MAKHLKHEFEKILKGQDRLADQITAFAGSMKFVYLHVFWFGAWIVVNLIGWIENWDPYPFNFLTMVVSLEAIFLSTFVLISQNRDTRRSDLRDQRDFEVDTQAEKEIKEIISRLDRIEQRLNRR